MTMGAGWCSPKGLVTGNLLIAKDLCSTGEMSRHVCEKTDDE